MNPSVLFRSFSFFRSALARSAIGSTLALMGGLAAAPVAFGQTSPSVAAVAETGARSGSIDGLLLPGAGVTAPLSDVTVTIAETGMATPVDRRGAFEFKSVPPGAYTLLAAGNGFSRLRITGVIVTPDRNLSLAPETILGAGNTTTAEERSAAAREDIATLVQYVVTDSKAEPYADRNNDLPRTIDDPQPYYIYSAQQIGQSGAVNVEDFLKNNVTMDTNAQSNSQKYRINYGTTSSANLRGLGSNQTLILIDGHRSAGVNFVGTVMQPSLNGLPLEAIDRVEVLPSAASAIYGASAVGGVINVVLKKDFTGGFAKYTYDSPFGTDAAIRTWEGTYGFALEGGKTHVMLSASYSDQHMLLNQDRPQIVAKAFAQILKNEPSFFYSANTPFAGGSTNIASSTGTNLTLKNGMALNSPLTYIAPGTAPGQDLTASLLANAGKQNTSLSASDGQYGLLNSMGVSPFDKNLLATVRREFGSNVEAFVNFSTGSDSGWAVYNVLARANTLPTVPSTAPTSPFAQTVVVNFPSLLNGRFYNQYATQNVSGGLRVRLPWNWKAALDYTWSQSLLGYNFATYDSTALAAALAAGTINPFVDTLQYQQNLAQFQVPVPTGTRASLNELSLRGTGPLFHLPWGDPVATFGLDHRKEGNGTSNQWEPFTLTTASAFHTTYFGQDETTDSAASELEIPLVTEKNALPGLRGLDLQAAARFEQYTISTGTAYYQEFPNAPSKSVYSGPLVHSKDKDNSIDPTIGLRYYPLKDVILRASYSTAYLPPTYSQLLPSLVPNASALTITDPRNNTNYAISQYTGGNPNLTPQSGTDLDLGVIYEPKGGTFQGLRLGLEYFRFREKNVIATLTAQQIIGFESVFPERVTRDAATGKITSVNATAINLAHAENDGYEATAEYGKRTPVGTLHFFAMGTIIEHYRQQTTPASPNLEYVGYVADGGVAKTRLTGRVTWDYRHFTLGWNTSWTDGYKQYGAPGDPLYNGSTTAALNTLYTAAQGSGTIPSQTYHTAFVSYAFPRHVQGLPQPVARALSGVEVTFGVKNVFNQVPPVDVFYTPYFYSPYGDPRLRDFWLSVKKSF